MNSDIVNRIENENGKVNDVFMEDVLVVNSRKFKKTLQKLYDEEEKAWFSACQEKKNTSYSVEKIRRFFVESKGQRAIIPELFFPDVNGFIKSVNRLRGDGVFLWSRDLQTEKNSDQNQGSTDWAEWLISFFNFLYHVFFCVFWGFFPWRWI